MDRRRFLALASAAVASPPRVAGAGPPQGASKDPFLVGTEYYRAPMPPQEMWEGDFAAIRRSGMRIVRTFSYWNWIEPRPGQYEVDDFDRFFELARKHDLVVWFDLTLATHGAAPEWMMRAHPDMRVVSADGQIARIGLAGNAAPQGKQQHCYDHPKWREYAERFVRFVVGRYRAAPNLLLWNAWDGVATPGAHAGFPLGCYCDHSLAAYRRWLEQRFTLDSLNARLHRRYRDWADVQPPRTLNAVVESMLWREFQYDDLKDQLRWLVARIKEVDDRHEVRAHGAHFPRCWDEISSAEVDSWGFSAPTNEVLTSSDPYRFSYLFFACDWSRSIGRGGRWYYEEIYAGMNPGSTTHKKQTSPEEIALNLWAALARGAAGAVFWQYRPEYMSFEGPGLNLVSAGGEPLPRLRAAERVMGQIRGLADLLPLRVPRAEVAVLYHDRTDLLYEFGNGSADYRLATQGIYRAFWEHNIPIDVVSQRMDWRPYRLVWLPSAALLEPELVEKIRAALRDPRGPAICVDGPLGDNAANGRFSYDPPEGLAALLGVKSLDYSRITAADLEGGANQLRTERFGTLALAAPCNWIRLGASGGTRPIAWYGSEVVGIETADRRLSWVTVPLAAALGSPGCEKLVLPLAQSLGIAPPVKSTGDRVLLQHARARDGGRLLFVFNLGGRTARARLEPGGGVASAREVVGGRALEVRGGAFEVEVPTGDARVVRLG
jgi:beta-galactosidase